MGKFIQFKARRWNEAMGLERFPSLKYNYVRKWESRFTTECRATEVKIGGDCGAGKLTRRQRRPLTKKNWRRWRNFLVASHLYFSVKHIFQEDQTSLWLSIFWRL